MNTPNALAAPQRLKKYFLTGLTLILPLWLTGYVVWALVRLAGNAIFPVLRPWLRGLLHAPPPEPLMISVAAVLVCALIVALGYVVTHYAGRSQLEAVEGFLARIPIVNSIHGVIKKVVDIFLGSKGAFQRVVRVEFPVPGQYMIGFVTAEGIRESADGGRLLPVLIPTAPNPTSGFLVFLPEDKAVFLDLSIDDAMGMILSVGTVSPESLSPRR